jgi:putative heme-binding domain-containing protein
MNSSISPLSINTTVLIFLLLLSCRESSEPPSPEIDPFGQNIRSTDPLDPAQERLALHLAEGFEIQLFASEPDIAKPLNMSFDHRGRMWLTQSYEYPFPDTTGAGQDKITILEDTNGDGTADKITTFADSLNIPIGIQVVPDGVLTYSIPNIWHLIDHDHDDKVDERKILYSGFKYGDTHGMVNNFVRSWDGWIHADHGFSNTSTVAGSDGDTIVMNSGNTFRFRMDGSRLEFTTTGRVNPYGYTYDEWGYTYSVDCHTSPVYQLVRGADYPHFGKKPTGIGFGPALMKHDYGSTALAGLEYYIADQFPKEYQENFYYGDVVRSRVSRSNFTMHGTTPVINQEEDFIISDDPWFRPVDVKIGPDGALYIADFYNRIIGHYEVPLDHPGRDRQRGRIWKITYTGRKATEALDQEKLLDLKELLHNLDHPNLPLRMSYADQIVDYFGKTAIPDLTKILSEEVSSKVKTQALWILFRLGGINNDIIDLALANNNDTITVHTLRILFEAPQFAKSLDVAQYLNSSDPHIQRQAAMVLSKIPAADQVGKLLQLLKTADQGDTHLYYSLRQSLRDQLRDLQVLTWVASQDWSADDSALLADVMRGVDHFLAAQFLLKHLRMYAEKQEMKSLYVTHAARWLPDQDLEEFVETLQPQRGSTTDESYLIFSAMLEGIKASGRELGKSGQKWAQELSADFLSDPLGKYAGWQTIPIDRLPYSSNTWQIIDSLHASRNSLATYLSSNALDGRGNGTSMMRSPDFKMPGEFTIILNGRKRNPTDGNPPSLPTNRLELVKSENQAVISQVEITQLNTDTIIFLRAGNSENSDVFLRLVDASSAGGENIAIGVLQPVPFVLPTISPEQVVERQVFAAQMVTEYNFRSLKKPLEEILQAEVTDVLAKNAAAKSLLLIEPEKTLREIDQILSKNPPLRLKELLLTALSEIPEPSARSLISKFMPEISYQVQKEIVMNIGQDESGIAYLIEAAKSVTINPRLLLEPLVTERLQLNMNAKQAAYFEELKSNLKPPNDQIDELINKRLRDYVATAYSMEKGQTFFSVFCSTCHEVAGQGGNIGPQLDGVGNWGARALSEKILDPNRNISKAFRTYNLQLKDGTVQSGLFRREEGAATILANEQGQEFTITRSDIVKQTPSPYTLMPDHFRETIPENDFKDLLAYLLSLKD